jgi:hypothetical protein
MFSRQRRAATKNRGPSGLGVKREDRGFDPDCRT